MRPEAVPFLIKASVKPEHVEEVLVAKSVLVAFTVPKFHPTGKVILMSWPAMTPVGVTN